MGSAEAVRKEHKRQKMTAPMAIADGNIHAAVFMVSFGAMNAACGVTYDDRISSLISALSESRRSWSEPGVCILLVEARP